MLDMKMDMQEVRHRGCKCRELELRCEKAEERCIELESELQTKNIEFELLKDQMKKLEVEKSEVEEELKVLMGKGRELGQPVSCVKDRNDVSFEEQKRGIVTLVGEDEVEDEVVQLRIENSVLECEKKRAESEVELWKDKYKQLEMKILKLDESTVLARGERVFSGRSKQGIESPDISPQACDLEGVPSTCFSLSKGTGDLQGAGTPSNGTPYNHTVSFGRDKKFGSSESDSKYGSRVRKQLNFEEENAGKKIAPSTPAVSRPAFHGIIDIIDSDDEPIISKSRFRDKKKSDICVSAAQASSGCRFISLEEKINEENKSKELHCDGKNSDVIEMFKDDFVFNSTCKRKRAANIVTSDTESDDEDDVPISQWKRMHFVEKKPTQESSKLSDSPSASTSAGDNAAVNKSPARRRLVSLRKCYEKGNGKTNSSSRIIESKNYRNVPMNEDVKDKSEGDGSELESEGESLGGFIVESSDACDVNASQSDDLSNGSVEYDEIISKLGRRKKELKWEYEADMLAAFGKDPELCMKAVCVLYRQQTSEEKISREALFSNKRGFSKFDAIKGTELAEFLTSGDPHGDLNKSVEELQVYDSNAIELCRKLATHYSKQLFEIYNNKEDPFFQRS